MTPERARKIAQACADSWYGGAAGLNLKEAITQGILEACQETEGDLVATRVERDYYRQVLAAALEHVKDYKENSALFLKQRDELAEQLAAARAALEEVCDALLTTDKNEQAMRMYQIAYAALAGEKK